MKNNYLEIATKCHTRIVANNGLYTDEYFIGCIADAIQEAVSAQQSVQRTAEQAPRTKFNDHKDEIAKSEAV